MEPSFEKAVLVGARVVLLLPSFLGDWWLWRWVVGRRERERLVLWRARARVLKWEGFSSMSFLVDLGGVRMWVGLWRRPFVDFFFFVFY